MYNLDAGCGVKLILLDSSAAFEIINIDEWLSTLVLRFNNGGMALVLGLVHVHRAQSTSTTAYPRVRYVDQ